MAKRRDDDSRKRRDTAREAVATAGRSNKGRSKPKRSSQKKGGGSSSRNAVATPRSSGMSVDHDPSDKLALARNMVAEARQLAREGDFERAERMLSGLEQSTEQLGQRIQGMGPEGIGTPEQRQARRNLMEQVGTTQGNVAGALYQELPLQESAQQMGVAPAQLQQDRQQARADMLLKQSEAKRNFYEGRGSLYEGMGRFQSGRADVVGAQGDYRADVAEAGRSQAQARDIESQRRLRDAVAQRDPMTAFTGERPEPRDSMSPLDFMEMRQLAAETGQLMQETQRQAQQFDPQTMERIETLRRENQQIENMLRNDNLREIGQAEMQSLINQWRANNRQLRTMTGMDSRAPEAEQSGQGQVGGDEPRIGRDAEGNEYIMVNGQWQPIGQEGQQGNESGGGGGFSVGFPGWSVQFR